ncbi:unnamed protein product [Calypogeia fissa]
MEDLGALLAGSLMQARDQERRNIRCTDAVDVFHMFFGVVGLSLLEYPGIRPIDPAYALLVHVVEEIFFSSEL